MNVEQRVMRDIISNFQQSYKPICDTYRTDRAAPTQTKIPPAMGKYRGVVSPEKHPINSATFTPKHNPGKSVGKSTPSDIPTKADSNDSTKRATMARSKPTGTKRGSKKMWVKNPDSRPAKIPEK